MSDLTRYRKRCEGMPHRNMQDEDCIGSCFEPDDTLQQIVDAAKHRIYIDANGTDPDSEPWVSFDGSEVNGLRHCFDNVEIEYVLIPAALLEGLNDEPIDEPGVQQAAHGGGDRGTPALVFNIKSDANLEETAKAIAKAVEDARLRIAEE